MLASTLMAIPFVPVFYVLLENLHEGRKRRRAPRRPAQLPPDESYGQGKP